MPVSMWYGVRYQPGKFCLLFATLCSLHRVLVFVNWWLIGDILCDIGQVNIGLVFHILFVIGKVNIASSLSTWRVLSFGVR